jgi:hypothetical protein
MSENEFYDFYDEDDDQDDHKQPREELALWLSEFMTASMDAENLYRKHFCTILTDRIYEEFCYEGFCEMMMVMDRKAGWISDIILENSDIDDILFKKYGVYDRHAIARARASSTMDEMNSKIWKLRRKYAKQIADELMTPASAADPDAEQPGKE